MLTDPALGIFGMHLHRGPSLVLKYYQLWGFMFLIHLFLLYNSFFHFRIEGVLSELDLPKVDWGKGNNYGKGRRGSKLFMACERISQSIRVNSNLLWTEVIRRCGGAMCVITVCVCERSTNEISRSALLSSRSGQAGAGGRELWRWRRSPCDKRLKS